MFAQEIERELRMLEEYVLTDDVSEDCGESMIQRDADFEPPEVPFQPKPTSVSIVAAATRRALKRRGRAAARNRRRTHRRIAPRRRGLHRAARRRARNRQSRSTTKSCTPRRR
jgi:hypothetical protein